MERPVFIKGQVEFQLDDTELQFNNKNISLFGVPGLPWGPLAPSKYFGSEVRAKLKVGEEAFLVETLGTIVREQTSYSDNMIVKFNMDAETRSKLKEVIDQFGDVPEETKRKYPRIPSSVKIQTFPLKVLATIREETSGLDQSPIIFDIANLSLGGLLASSENPYTSSIVPGTELDIYFEPRGGFSLPISLKGKVRRIMDEINSESGNLVRQMGIKFTEVPEESRVAYLELLRDILTRMKGN